MAVPMLKWGQMTAIAAYLSDVTKINVKLATLVSLNLNLATGNKIARL